MTSKIDDDSLTERRNSTMPNPKRRHSKTRTAKRRTHDALKPWRRRVPAVPRAQAAAQRVRELRLLPRPSGPRGRRRVGLASSAVAACTDRAGPTLVRRRRRHGRRPCPGPGRRRRARGRSALGLAVDARRPQPSIEPSCTATPTGPPAITVVDAPEVVGMAEAPLTALRRKPRASIRVAAERVARRRGGGALQRRPHRRDASSRRTARSACCRASIGRRWRRPFRHATRRGGPARRRRQRRLPARAPAASSR